MRVKFYDKLRETFLRLDDVVSLDVGHVRVNGRVTSVWFVCFVDGSKRTFKVRDFSVHSVNV